MSNARTHGSRGHVIPVDEKIAEMAARLDRGSRAVVRDFERDLRVKQVKPLTIWSYYWALVRLHEGTGVPVLAATKQQIGDHLAGLTDLRTGKPAKPSSVDTHFRALRRFFRWADAEGDLLGKAGNPMRRIEQPAIGEQLVPVITDEDIEKLLRTCRPRSPGFADRRDEALIEFMLTPGGPRAAEVCGVAVDHLNLDRDICAIVGGKGDRDRVIGMGPKAARAVSRYLRLREQRADAGTHPQLWLGKYGPLTRSGLAQMLARRCEQAGIAKIHPHQLRHTAAHNCRAAGLDPLLARHLFGWSETSKMWDRYGASAAGALAVATGQDLAGQMERKRA